MARLWSSGFELNSITADIEWTTSHSTPTISTTTVRSGTYAARVSSLGAAKGLEIRFQTAAANGPFYFRVYTRFATFPGAENRFILLNNADGLATPIIYLTIDNTGVLKLYDEDGQITGTTTLSTDTWYRIEFEVDVTAAAGAHIVKARVDGTEFASSTARSLSAGVMNMAVGANLASEANTTGDWFFDDVAINDNTGSFQTSYPGEGEIIHLRPNAAGDNAQWTRGGTDSGANWSQVDEVTPNDATDYVQSNTANQIDDYNIDDTPATLEITDTINCIQIGARISLSAGTAEDPDFVYRVKVGGGGTVEESANVSTTTTNWRTNSNNGGATGVRNYFLTLYDLPGASTTSWNKTYLDAMQIGVRETVTDTHFIRISDMWVLVDHKPGTLTGNVTRVAASSDDGFESGGTVNIAGTDVSIGNNSNTITAGFRFLNVAVPVNATITSALFTIKGSVSYTTANTINAIAYCEAVDDSATFTTADNNIEGRARTTANSGGKNIQSVTAESDYIWDVTTAVQEVINRAGWASGQDISVLLVDNGSTNNEWQDFYSYDGSATKAARLDIIYTTATKAKPIFKNKQSVWRRRF